MSLLLEPYSVSNVRSAVVTHCYNVIVDRQGTVVFWNLLEEEQHNFLRALQPFELHAYGNTMVNDQSDSMQFRYAQ